MYYAQINELGICYAVSETANEILQNNMIKIDIYKYDLIGKRFNNLTRQWEDVINEDKSKS